MSVSVFDIFRVGIGPSSSHTVGPMRAAVRFSKELIEKGLDAKTDRIWVDLMGSLGATGIGHATDTAFQLGLMGMLPADVDLDAAPGILQAIKTKHQLTLANGKVIHFDPSRDIILSPEKVAIYHTNAMHVIAQDKDGNVLLSRRYYSVGGGFIVESDPDNFDKVSEDKETVHTKPQPYPISTAADLMKWCNETGLSIPEIVRANERVWWETDEKINRLVGLHGIVAQQKRQPLGVVLVNAFRRLLVLFEIHPAQPPAGGKKNRDRNQIPEFEFHLLH